MVTESKPTVVLPLVAISISMKRSFGTTTGTVCRGLRLPPGELLRRSCAHMHFPLVSSPLFIVLYLVSQCHVFLRGRYFGRVLELHVSTLCAFPLRKATFDVTVFPVYVTGALRGGAILRYFLVSLARDKRCQLLPYPDTLRACSRPICPRLRSGSSRNGTPCARRENAVSQSTHARAAAACAPRFASERNRILCDACSHC